MSNVVDLTIRLFAEWSHLYKNVFDVKRYCWFSIFNMSFFFLMWVLSKCLVNLLSLYMHYMLSYHFGIINIFQIKIIKYLAIMFILLKFVSRLIKHWGKSSLKRAELGHIAVQYKIYSMFHYDMYRRNHMEALYQNFKWLTLGNVITGSMYMILWNFRHSSKCIHAYIVYIFLYY